MLDAAGVIDHCKFDSGCATGECSILRKQAEIRKNDDEYLTTLPTPNRTKAKKVDTAVILQLSNVQERNGINLHIQNPKYSVHFVHPSILHSANLFTQIDPQEGPSAVVVKRHHTIRKFGHRRTVGIAHMRKTKVFSFFSASVW